MTYFASNDDIFIFDEQEQEHVPNLLNRYNSNESVSLFAGLCQRSVSNDGVLGSKNRQYHLPSEILRNEQSEVNLVTHNQRVEKKSSTKFLTIQELAELRNNEEAKQMKTKSVKKRPRRMNNYNKNICGYVTKKVIREFINNTFNEKIQELCFEHDSVMAQCKSFYLARIQSVTGPSHVPSLFIPEHCEEVKIKKVFSKFFQWFLKERYLRYLLTDGKMEHKRAYIKYKNTALFQLWQTCQNFSLTSNPS